MIRPVLHSSSRSTWIKLDPRANRRAWCSGIQSDPETNAKKLVPRALCQWASLVKCGRYQEAIARDIYFVEFATCIVGWRYATHQVRRGPNEFNSNEVPLAQFLCNFMILY